jgi:hypothetical protein
VTNNAPIVYDVLPRVGAGAIRLGMSRAEARRVLGVPVRSYPKVPGAPLTDTYFGADLQVAYDADDRVQYIELNGPGAVDAVFHGRSLLMLPAEGVLAWMKRFAEYDPDDPEVGYSYIYPDLDLSVWRPTLPEGSEDDEGRFFRSVGVARAGYYANGGRA